MLQALLDEVLRDHDWLRVEISKERQERERLVPVIEEQAAVRSRGEQIKLLTDQREQARRLVGR